MLGVALTEPGNNANWSGSGENFVDNRNRSDASISHLSRRRTPALKSWKSRLAMVTGALIGLAGIIWVFVSGLVQGCVGTSPSGISSSQSTCVSQSPPVWLLDTILIASVLLIAISSIALAYSFLARGPAISSKEPRLEPS